MNNAVIIYIYTHTHTFKYQYFNKEIVFEYPIKVPLSFAYYIIRLFVALPVKGQKKGTETEEFLFILQMSKCTKITLIYDFV